VRSSIRDETAPGEHEPHRGQGEVRRAGGGVDLWQVPEEVRELRRPAQGLWNLFLPAGYEEPYAERFGTRGGTRPTTNGPDEVHKNVVARIELGKHGVTRDAQ
jgi:hypothetical protein